MYKTFEVENFECTNDLNRFLLEGYTVFSTGNCIITKSFLDRKLGS